MDWLDYLKQEAVIEDCRRHYYDNMTEDITDSDEEYGDYEDEDNEEVK